MAQVTFGTVLREARERKGYDLSTAARRLRIRPDILRAIEEDDFARMPPRGYTRNMVNAYARLLGLNPTEITRMYLDEAYAYQVGRARSDVRPTGFDMGGTSRTKRTRERQAQPEEFEERPARQNAFGRTLYDDRTSFTRPDYGRSGGTGGRLYSEDRTHTSRHTALPNAQYTNFYAGPKAPSPVQSKLPFIIAGAVILVVLVLVLMLVFGNKGGGQEEDVPKMPITGITDTTQGENGGDGQQQPVTSPAPTAPTKAVFEYEIPSDNSSYIEIYENGSESASVAETINGPAKASFDVTEAGTLLFVTSNPDGVKISVDGEAVEPTESSQPGVYTYTVDFAAILDQWKKDHPTASTGSNTGGAATNAGANAASNPEDGGSSGGAADAGDNGDADA